MKIIEMPESAFYKSNNIYELCKYLRDQGYTEVRIIRDIKIIKLQTVEPGEEN